MLIIKRLFRLFMLTLILLTTYTQAVADRQERLIDGWRPLHYEVELAFDDKLSELTSVRTAITVEIVKDSVSTIDFDFGEMPVLLVRIGAKLANFSQKGGKLLVTLEHAAKKKEQVTLTVVYRGRPKDGLIFTADKDGRPSVTGDNWPNRVHHWIPTLDHPSAKATVRFSITAPARDLVVANGRLESTRLISNKTRTWVWNEEIPISPYCMIVAAGEFARFDARDQRTTPLSYYVPKSDGRFAMQGFAPAAPSLKYFSETVGTYPYEKLAMIVGATRYGGMENSSAIVFGSGLFRDFQKSQPRSQRYDIPGNVRNVVSHEIAHQWFGDSITEATWADLWLSEGFATYFAGLFIEKYEGKDDFRAYMKEVADRYFTYEKQTKTPIHDKETEDLNALLNPNNYEKGAWVLHMLRGLIGDRAFFLGIRDYYSAHRDSTATTEDLRTAMETTSGLNLKDFFTRWVYGSGHPRYEASWRFATGDDSSQAGILEITLRQVQDGGDPFLIPIPVEIVTSEGPQRETIRPRNRDTVARFILTHQPISVKFDPDDVVLKELSIKQN